MAPKTLSDKLGSISDIQIQEVDAAVATWTIGLNFAVNRAMTKKIARVHRNHSSPFGLSGDTPSRKVCSAINCQLRPSSTQWLSSRYENTTGCQMRNTHTSSA